MRESLHSKIIFRAAHIKGGAGPLAQALGVSVPDVQAWMHSTSPLPDQHIGRLLDIIAEGALRDLDERNRSMDPRTAGSR